MKLYRSIVLVLALTTVGCTAIRPRMSWAPFRATPSRLAADASLDEIVAHLNQNTSSAWRSTDVRIRARGQGGLPISLSAVLAVQSPRRLRLIANSIAGNEIDVGSNSDRFWVWMRRSEPKGVFTASHEQMARSQVRLPIPFQPDWLIEALGVIPMDSLDMRLRKDAKRRTSQLISEGTSPQGDPVHKITTVDMHAGVVLEHAVYDASGRPLATARFSDHQRDSSGLVLPHRIELKWPNAGMQLSMQLGPIEVNPQAIPSQTWDLPEYPDTPIVDLGRYDSEPARRVSHNTYPPTADGG